MPPILQKVVQAERGPDLNMHELQELSVHVVEERLGNTGSTDMTKISRAPPSSTPSSSRSKEHQVVTPVVVPR